MELWSIDNTEWDLPPEFCRYHDEGCEFASSCLNCPLPLCVHDEPGGRQRLLKRRRGPGRHLVGAQGACLGSVRR